MRHGQNSLDVINSVLKSESSGICIVSSGGLAAVTGAQLNYGAVWVALAATPRLNFVDRLQRVHHRSQIHATVSRKHAACPVRHGGSEHLGA